MVSVLKSLFFINCMHVILVCFVFMVSLKSCFKIMTLITLEERYNIILTKFMLMSLTKLRLCLCCTQCLTGMGERSSGMVMHTSLSILALAVDRLGYWHKIELPRSYSNVHYL